MTFPWKNAFLEIALTENSGIAYVILECFLLSFLIQY